ncbi:MAG: hypothetical protein CME55_07395 [Halieaceae bacterium]|nr:hypothetical protein [Halieaceae bacterium]
MHARHTVSTARTGKLLRVLMISAVACGCTTTWAAGGAHEHGAAELLLSSEGKDIQITFNAPAQSLVGFESAAITEEQKAAVARAEAILMAPHDLFSLTGNSCELIDATVDVSSLGAVATAPSQPEAHADHSEEHADDHDDHDDHDEDHASTSDNHVHEHHDHDDDGDASDADSHSDVSASYTFECESNEALTRIVFNRDGLPFGLERIDVLWVADWGQGAGQATPQSPSVNLQN